MEVAFYLSAFIAIFSTVFAVFNVNPVHGLLSLIVSLLAVAMMFFCLGAPFAGILEIIVYAGAIFVLFLFVVMLLNLGHEVAERERHWLKPRVWLLPSGLTLVMLAELVRLLAPVGAGHAAGVTEIGAVRVGMALYGPYLLAVEMASMLLLAGLVAAWHLGRHDN